MSNVAFFSVHSVFRSNKKSVVPINAFFSRGQQIFSFLFCSKAGLIDRFSPFVKIAGNIVNSKWIVNFNRIFASRIDSNNIFLSVQGNIKFSLFSLFSILGILHSFNWILASPKVFSTLDSFFNPVYRVKAQFITQYIHIVNSIFGLVPSNTINIKNKIFASQVPFSQSLLKIHGFIRFKWIQSFETLANIVNVSWIRSSPLIFSTADQFDFLIVKIRGQLITNFSSFLKIISFVDRFQQSFSYGFRLFAVLIERFKPLFKIKSIVSNINWVVTSPKLFSTSVPFVNSILSIRGKIISNILAIFSTTGFSQNFSWILNNPKLFSSKDVFQSSFFTIRAFFLTDFVKIALSVFANIHSATINIVQKTFATKDQFSRQFSLLRGFIKFKTLLPISIFSNVINTVWIIATPKIFSSRMFPTNMSVSENFTIVAFAIGRFWSHFKTLATLKIHLRQLFRSDGKLKEDFFYIFRVKSSLRDFFNTKIRSRGRAVFSAFYYLRFSGFSIEVIIEEFRRRFTLLGFADSHYIVNRFSVNGFTNRVRQIFFSVNANLILLSFKYFIASATASSFFKNAFQSCALTLKSVSNAFTLSGLLSRYNINLSFVFATIQKHVSKTFLGSAFIVFPASVKTLFDGAISNRFFFSAPFTALVKSKSRSFFKIHATLFSHLQFFFSATSNVLDSFICHFSITGRSIFNTFSIISIRSLVATKTNQIVTLLGETIRRSQRSFKIFGSKQKPIEKCLRIRGIALSSVNSYFKVRSAVGSLTSSIFEVLGFSPAVPKEIFPVNANVQNDHHVVFYSCIANAKSLMYIELNYNRNQQTYKSQKFCNGKRWFS